MDSYCQQHKRQK